MTDRNDRRGRRQRGYSLLETMIVLLIASILGVAAIPSLSAFIKNNRLKTRMYELVNAVALARSEAVTRAQSVVICPSAAPLAASPTCTDNSWQTGWLVFADVNGNGVYDAGTDTLLRVTEGDTTLSFTLNADQTYGFDGLTIKSDATSGETAGGVTGEAVLALCDDRGTKYGIEVRLTRMGRPSITNGNITTCSPP